MKTNQAKIEPPIQANATKPILGNSRINPLQETTSNRSIGTIGTIGLTSIADQSVEQENAYSAKGPTPIQNSLFNQPLPNSFLARQAAKKAAQEKMEQPAAQTEPASQQASAVASGIPSLSNPLSLDSQVPVIPTLGEGRRRFASRAPDQASGYNFS